MKRFAGNLRYLLIISCVASFAFLVRGCTSESTGPESVPGIVISHVEAHVDTQIEWWYYFAHVKGKTTGKSYGLMAAFFVNRLAGDRPAGYYLLHEVIDLSSKIHRTTSRADTAFMQDLSVAMSAAYMLILKRKPSAIEQKYLDDLYAANPPLLHDILRGKCTVSNKPLNLSYDGALFSVTSDRKAFESICSGNDYSFSLSLKPEKEVVPFNGDGKLTDIMYYYSYTRLRVGGTLTLNGFKEEVEGGGWFDHQYQFFDSTSTILLPDGWRWAGVQSEDNRDIQLYQFHDLRTQTLKGSGMITITSPDGKIRSYNDISYSSSASWTSPATNTVYPVISRWISAGAGIEIILTPRFQEQEMPALFPFNASIWEGSCDALIINGNDTVKGIAFQELNGFMEIR